jgi:hypothetical protein
VRFQVLTAASMMFRIVFWDVLPCKTHPWWWRQYAPLKRRSTIILHGSTSQKTILNITVWLFKWRGGRESNSLVLQAHLWSYGWQEYSGVLWELQPIPHKQPCYWTWASVATIQPLTPWCIYGMALGTCFPVLIPSLNWLKAGELTQWGAPHQILLWWSN